MNSVRNVLIVNLVLVLLGLTPFYPVLSQALQNLSRPAAYFLVNANQRLLNFTRFVSRLPFVDRQNADLKNQLLQKKLAEARLSELQKENALLRAQLKLPASSQKQKLFMSTVLGKQEKSDLVILRGGEKDGLAAGNLVEAGGVLLGKVVEVYARQSKMRLTVSAESRFTVRTGDFAARGEVTGNFGSQLLLSKVLPSQSLSLGQTVVEVESGLLVGTVVKVEKEGAKIFKEAQVAAAYDPNLLDQVLVMVGD